MPYLIQHLNRKEEFRGGTTTATETVPDSERSFDQIFDLEYMGSSEFERGVIPSSYRLLLSLEVSIREVELTRNGVTRTVFFVATDDVKAYDDMYNAWTHAEITRFDQFVDYFQAWLQQPCLRSKEITYFDMLFEDAVPAYMQEHPPKVVAWWDLHENIAWTLDETVAQDLLQAFTIEPQPARAWRYGLYSRENCRPGG